MRRPNPVGTGGQTVHSTPHNGLTCGADRNCYLSRMLRFLSRVAFISNLFLIPVLLIHHVPSFRQWDAGLISHIVITAYFIALPINVLVNGWLLATKLSNKRSGIPLWLQVANALFLLLQIYYFQFT